MPRSPRLTARTLHTHLVIVESFWIINSELELVRTARLKVGVLLILTSSEDTDSQSELEKQQFLE